MWWLEFLAETDTVGRRMTALLVALLAAIRSAVRSRLELEAEILALRHQLAVLQRRANASPTWPHRPPLVGAAVAAVAKLAGRRPDRHARHRRALASSRVRALLVMEITAATGGPASGGRGHPGADPADARRQPCGSPESDRQPGTLIRWSVARQDSACWPRSSSCCDRAHWAVADLGAVGLENLALHQQLAVFRCTDPRPHSAIDFKVSSNVVSVGFFWRT